MAVAAALLRTIRGIFIEKQRKEHNNKPTNTRMAAAGSRIAKASSGQNRISPEERTAMELWLKTKRDYGGGKGKEMTNLRWINGAASKGLQGVSGDPKQAKQIGAYEALAAFMNTKQTKKKWDAEIANKKWKNMKTSFKRAVNKYEMPDTQVWEQSGKSKEELATEVENVTTLRKAACQSYEVLWEELQNHPTISPAAPFETPFAGDDGDGDNGGGDEVNEDEEDEGDEVNEDEDEEGDEDATASGTAKSPKAAKSPMSPKSSAAGSKNSGAKAKASPKKREKGSKASVKKLSLRKASEQPRHRDITAAYISMKSEWNRMWLRTMVLKQRQDVYFMCLERGMDRATTIHVMQDLGLGKLPAFMDSWYRDEVPDMHEQGELIRGSGNADDFEEGEERRHSDDEDD